MLGIQDEIRQKDSDGRTPRIGCGAERSDPPGGLDVACKRSCRVRLGRPLCVNLDGIAKGYAVDRAVV